MMQNNRDSVLPDKSKTVAIMQPYLFPYLGYFQLAAAVDEFWLLDTVGFIREGWMNRNKILVNGNEYLFTIPVKNKSYKTPISEYEFSTKSVYYLKKLTKTIYQSYSQANYKHIAHDIILETLDYLKLQNSNINFTEVIEYTLNSIFKTIYLDTPIKKISQLNLNSNLTGQARIISACKTIGASIYVNMIGGKELYDAADFQREDISLYYLQAVLPPYPQSVDEFVPGLSILDVLANVSPNEIADMLNCAIISRSQ